MRLGFVLRMSVYLTSMDLLHLLLLVWSALGSVPCVVGHSSQQKSANACSLPAPISSLHQSHYPACLWLFTDGRRKFMHIPMLPPLPHLTRTISSTTCAWCLHFFSRSKISRFVVPTTPFFSSYPPKCEYPDSIVFFVVLHPSSGVRGLLLPFHDCAGWRGPSPP
jgi:hypothetical protein